MVKATEREQSVKRTAERGESVGTVWDNIQPIISAEAIEAFVRPIREAQLRLEEGMIRNLLGRWVSGCTPSIARGPDGELLGLCDADAMLGTQPFILRP